ncbi:MAG: CHAP domain-containing protein [Nocardioidaceae bacterium]|nr:CHAP domain-containing protein [Nocardioidaceae bacterium]
MTVRWWSSVIAGVMFATLLVVGGGGARLLHLRETSGSTYLCTGYDGCNAAGYSDSGYGRVNGKSYWRMYPGHNCVNYVAYRMIQAGMPTARPWNGDGNAANWGHAEAGITDQTPAVGAVAWFDAYHHVGSAGHVAYVEKVVSPSEIVISEDSWGGTFHWQRLTKTGGFWPSGFIHFKDKSAGPVLANQVKPFIDGTAKVGQQLTGHVGTWSGKPSHYAYQWTAKGAPIAGATSSTFTVTAAQLNRTIGLTVTGSHPKSTSVSTSADATAAVVRGTFTNGTLPTVSGTPIVDDQLTASPGSWTPDPASYTYTWLDNGQAISGATTQTLPLTSGMVGDTITLIAHARAAGFKTATRTSQTTVDVAAGQIEVSTPYTVSGTMEPGSVLNASGAFTPASATPSYQWTRDGQKIPGATGASYQLQAADLGHHVAVNVSLAQPQWLPASGHAATPGYIRTPTHVLLKSVGVKGGAVIHLHVHSADVRTVSGKVLVRIGRVRRAVQLVNGSAKVEVTGLRAGHYPVRVYYGRTATTLPSSRTGGVTVR